MRLRSGGLTSKNGFSVVAPISVSVPSSTAGSSASCWALVKRWISSRNRIVPWSRSPSRCRARSITSRTSLTPAVTADICSNARAVRAGDGQRQRGLAGAGRAPEDRRRQAVLLDQPPQRPARADQVVLADDVVDRARPQPGGERRRRPQALLGGRGEQVIHRCATIAEHLRGTGRAAELDDVVDQLVGASIHCHVDELVPSGVGSTSSSSGVEEEPAVDLPEPLATSACRRATRRPSSRRAGRSARTSLVPSPVSSRSSRQAACSGVSPDSMPALRAAATAPGDRHARTPAPARRIAARRRPRRRGSAVSPSAVERTERARQRPSARSRLADVGEVGVVGEHLAEPTRGARSCRRPGRAGRRARTTAGGGGRGPSWAASGPAAIERDRLLEVAAVGERTGGDDARLRPSPRGTVTASRISRQIASTVGPAPQRPVAVGEHGQQRRRRRERRGLLERRRPPAASGPSGRRRVRRSRAPAASWGSSLDHGCDDPPGVVEALAVERRRRRGQAFARARSRGSDRRSRRGSRPAPPDRRSASRRGRRCRRRRPRRGRFASARTDPSSIHCSVWRSSILLALERRVDRSRAAPAAARTSAARRSASVRGSGRVLPRRHRTPPGRRSTTAGARARDRDRRRAPVAPPLDSRADRRPMRPDLGPAVRERPRLGHRARLAAGAAPAASAAGRSGWPVTGAGGGSGRRT